MRDFNKQEIINHMNGQSMVDHLIRIGSTKLVPRVVNGRLVYAEESPKGESVYSNFHFAQKVSYFHT